ncbi:Na+/H+ antiporter subunit E [Patulibacter sp.]|uniref:Na+/H+ antiporter subunit E n=1 Tax=Patulibacter sp. TaxID=1912859 RepID=UPI002725F25E|nr:Na+/H+ antiporter subunit E [Patulibacter sp.]MDO9410309.1 Na+/H+ antiporter subunit E [Patulibacter sp.]
MSPVRRIGRLGRRLVRRPAAGSRILQPVAVLWLVVLWVLLWGRVTPGLVVTGLLVGLLSIAMFPLPPLAIEGRVRPLSALRFGARFAYDVVRASVQVATLAFRRDQEAPTAVIGVPLITHSDLMLTVVAEVLSLVPGSLVVEIDRHDAIVYLHLIGVRDRDDVELERRRAQETEARMIRAFGSPADRHALAEGGRRDVRPHDPTGGGRGAPVGIPVPADVPPARPAPDGGTTR